MNKVMRYDCTNGKAQHCYGCYQMTETNEGEWVQAMDYDAAQSEIAALREELAESEDKRRTFAKQVSEGIDKLEAKLTAAEQRNAVIEADKELLRHQLTAAANELRRASSWICREVEAGTTSATHWAIRLRTNADQIEIALAQPTESGASE